MQYRAYTPELKTETLKHIGTPLVKYMYGFSNAFGIVVTLTAVNDVSKLRSSSVTINVPVRSAGNIWDKTCTLFSFVARNHVYFSFFNVHYIFRRYFSFR